MTRWLSWLLLLYFYIELTPVASTAALDREPYFMVLETPES